MSVEDATYYMKRCVDSGLWLPSAEGEEAGERLVGMPNRKEEEEGDADADADAEAEAEEEDEE